jgi:hypothetical protein
MLSLHRDGNFLRREWNAWGTSLIRIKMVLADLRIDKAMLPILHTFSLIENVPEMSRLLNRFSIKKWAGDFLV